MHLQRIKTNTNKTLLCMLKLLRWDGGHDLPLIGLCWGETNSLQILLWHLYWNSRE